MKKMWMNVLYTLLCNKLYNKRDIETIEKLVFLVQYQSCAKFYKPFVPYKIYVCHNKVKIKYLSYLLRIEKPIKIYYKGYDTEKFEKYFIILDQYKDKTDEEINDLVLEIIKYGNLKKKYFKLEEYNNYKDKIDARITFKRQQHIILAFLRTLLAILPICIIIAISFLYMFYSNLFIDNKIFLERIHGGLLFSLACIIIFLLWTLIWSKPTSFEKTM